ncbi:unnamed protein product [Lactuca saligna]|uniref:Uncharacterized protein n=1 Tax=Lactuca saligna TaxID=75948 RepID=A0AA35ZVI4_LACSI|nr:unnamed protein product [Lactuca saligna]
MDDVYDLDSINVELDYFKRKLISQCRDEFLNILCEEDDDNDANDDAQAQNNAQPQIHNQELDSEYVQSNNEEDIEDDFKYSIHNPKVKWNLMKPVLGERYESPHELKWCITIYAISKGLSNSFQKV